MRGRVGSGSYLEISHSLRGASSQMSSPDCALWMLEVKGRAGSGAHGILDTDFLTRLESVVIIHCFVKIIWCEKGSGLRTSTRNRVKASREGVKKFGYLACVTLHFFLRLRERRARAGLLIGGDCRRVMHA